MTRILSGIRPSGKLHLGNYLGAIKNWIELQDRQDIDLAVFMIADYHGITTPFDPKKYSEQILETACEFLAAGLDYKKVLLIRQSQIPQHTELAWIFSSITPETFFRRLPTFTEKIKEVIEKKVGVLPEDFDINKTKYLQGYFQDIPDISLGLLAYPALMAADILIYKANLVPVGQDQLPHIYLTNEIVKRFNSKFGETFGVVKEYIAEGAKIMSLQNPKQKMSKSADEGIALNDSPSEIKEKIKKAVTDSGKEIIYEPQKKPAISNLITLYKIFSRKSLEEIKNQYEGKTYIQFKDDLAEIIIEFLKPFQKRYSEFKSDSEEVKKILEISEGIARNEAKKTLHEIKQKIGLL
ncbi:MAG: tryptophan--tRNA ligase [Patescibacteria group bacterium]